MNPTCPCYHATALSAQRSFAGGQTVNAGRSHREEQSRSVRRTEHRYIRFDELVLSGGRLDHLLDIGYPPKQSRIPDALSSTVTNPQRKTWFLYLNIEMKNRREKKKLDLRNKALLI